MLHDLHWLQNEKLLTVAEVYTQLNIGRSTWLNGVKRGLYLQPLRIGPRCVRWRASDIEKLPHHGADEAASAPRKKCVQPPTKVRKKRAKA